MHVKVVKLRGEFVWRVGRQFIIVRAASSTARRP